VCVRAKTQNAEGLQLILSTSVWSKTVYHKYKFLKLSMGFETVCPEKDRQTAFYSPLMFTKALLDYALFRGHFWPKYDGWAPKKRTGLHHTNHGG